MCACGTIPAFCCSGLPFSLTLLAILMAHEMGHYLDGAQLSRGRLAAVFSARADADRHPGRVHPHPLGYSTKRAMFDIGIAGPMAGFVALLVPLAVGLSLSKVAPGIVQPGRFDFRQSVDAALLRADCISGRRRRETSTCIRWRARRGWDCWRRR